MSDENQNKIASLIKLLQSAKDQLITAEKQQFEPISVIGMALRVPGARDINTFWQNLLQGCQYFTSYPQDRYFANDLTIQTCVGGFIDHVFHFDAAFFDIAPQEALYMDPQQRMMLQLVYAALYDAGYEKNATLPARTAVIIGASGSDYSRLTLSADRLPTPYSITGVSLNAIAGRVAYCLNTHGPAFAIDSACSSSLVAIDTAVSLLRAQKIDMAIVGGINLMLCPESTNALLKTNVISPTARCLPFSDLADGMLRGEGGGVVVLMRQADRVLTDHSAYANIIASSVNQDGKSAQLTAPNGQAQKALLKAALTTAKLTPEQIAFIEAHGTATKLGDPIELDALHSIYGKRSSPLYIGSLKGNIGHLEAAAGIVGLIKSVLVAYHGMIPPHIETAMLTKSFDWQNSPLRIPKKLESFESLSAGYRYTAVSSFGFSGTNAHAIISPLDKHDGLVKTEARVKVFDEVIYKLDLAPPINQEKNNAVVYKKNWSKINLFLSEHSQEKIQNKVMSYLYVKPDDKNKIEMAVKTATTATNIFCINDERQIEKFLSPISMTTIFIVLPDEVENFNIETFLLAAQYVFKFLQTVAKLANQYSLQLFLISTKAHAILPTDKKGLLLGSLGSLLQSFRNENKLIPVTWLDIETYNDLNLIWNNWQGVVAFNGPDIAYRRGYYYVSELQQQSFILKDTHNIDSGTYLVTGGNGDIGQSLIMYLARSGVESIASLSRKALPLQFIAQFTTFFPNCQLRSYQVDISDYQAFNAILTCIEKQMPSIVAIYHLAGSIHDGLMRSQELTDFLSNIKAKIIGAWHCHQLTQSRMIKQFVLFSSASTYLGSLGQSGYCLANTFLNQLAEYRVIQELPATCIAFGAIANTASTQLEQVKKNLLRAGMDLMQPERALKIMANLVAEKATNTAVFELNWPIFLNQHDPKTIASHYFSNFYQPTTIHDPLSLIIAAIKKVLPDIDVTNLDKHLPLEFYGLSSLATIELSDLLSKAFNKGLPAGFLYSYPTINAILDFFNSGQQAQQPLMYPAVKTDDQDEEIAIIGISCRFPGGINSLDALWDGLINGKTFIENNKRKGWFLQLADYTESLSYPYISSMGLIKDYDWFDAEFFKISPREVKYMDPQHRIALETAWHALEDANIIPDSAKSTIGGVFLGVGTPDFTQLLSSDKNLNEAFIATGSANSLLAGRIAYSINWQGPVMTIDTACSSSLVSIYQACQSLKSGECKIALAGAVSLILTPASSVLLAKSKALSPQGRCAAFSAEADGYVRSEGCAFLVLKTLAEAKHAGDKIYAVIKGGAINHDGKSQGLTAPNGQAQQAVMLAALQACHLSAEQINYIEAHGTGTPLGDPIEMESINAVYARSRDKTNPLYVGTLKSNLGHMESVAGIAGLIKCILMLLHQQIPMQVNCSTVHPSCQLNNEQGEKVIYLAEQPQSWGDAKQRFAAVSSFGFSGTNAHLIIREVNELSFSVTQLTKTNFIKNRYPIPGYDDAYNRYFNQSFILPDGVQAIQLPFTATIPFLFADHRLFQTIVIPGATYLVMAMRWLLQNIASKRFSFCNIFFTSACVLKEQATGYLQMHISASQFNCFTYIADDKQLIKRCSFEYTYHVEEELELEHRFKKWLAERDVAEEKSCDDYYYFLHTQFVYLGESFQCIKKILYDKEMTVTKIILPEADLTVGAFDSLFQTIGLCLQGAGHLEEGVRVPTRIERIQFYDTVQEECYVLTELAAHSQGDFLTHHIHVFSASGRLLLSIINLQTQRISIEKLSISAPHPSLLDAYTWSWQSIDTSMNTTRVLKQDRIIFDMQAKVSANNLTNINILVQKKIIENKMIILTLLLPVFESLEEEHALLIDYINNIYSICTLAVKYASSPLFHLTIVSVNAFKIFDREKPQTLLASILYGCFKTIRLEYPFLSYEWHDLEKLIPDFDIPHYGKQFDRISVFVHRQGKVFVPKLQRYQWVYHQHYSVSEKKCHIIVGSSSKIARELLRYLIESGAKEIALIQRDNNPHDLPYAPATNIKTYLVDPLIESDMAIILQTIKKQQGCIATIYNLIGQLADGLFITQTAEQYVTSIYAKVKSSWIIHQLIANDDIHLVLFSSAAIVFGAIGQGGYAGANQYLHGLADLRRSLNLVTTVIAWGDWAIENARKNEDHATQIGLQAFKPQQALESLHWAMTENNYPNYPAAIFTMDWAILSNNKQMRTIMPYDLTFLLQPIAITALQAEEQLKIHLMGLPFYEQENYITTELKKIISKILNLNEDHFSTQADLTGLGLESITAVELREEINKIFFTLIPVAELFEKQNVLSLTKKILFNLNLNDIEVKNKIATKDEITALAALLEEDV